MLPMLDQETVRQGSGWNSERETKKDKGRGQDPVQERAKNEKGVGRNSGCTPEEKGAGVGAGVGGGVGFVGLDTGAGVAVGVGAAWAAAGAGVGAAFA